MIKIKRIRSKKRIKSRIKSAKA